MAQSALHSARLKLARSEELLDEIESAFERRNAAVQPTQMPLSWEDEQDILTGRIWHVVRLPFDPPEPDEHWGLLVGDAIHNARSALDHLACRLVEHNGKKVTIRTQFPIWTTKSTPGEQRKRFNGRIAGMSPAHKASIRKLQPFANPGTVESRRLNALSVLDNLDKHQVLVPMEPFIWSAHARPPEFKTLFPTQADFKWNDGKRAEKGVEVIRFSLRRPTAITNITADLPLVPTFGDERHSLDELRAIRAYVVGIVESFAHELT